MGYINTAHWLGEMIPPVYQLLAASPAVGAIVGDRIGASGEVFANETRPYVTWQCISGFGELTLDRGRAALDRVTVQVDCWHNTTAGRRKLAEAVRAALEGDGVYTGLAADERDAETGLYRWGFQFDFILI